MNTLRTFFTKTNNITKGSYIWNIIACTSNSFQSMLLLLVISRCAQVEDAAIFTIGYTFGTLLLHIGKYGVRNFQVSDINQEFSYTEYHRHRVFTVTLMSIFGAIYMLWGYLFKDYSIYKCLCMLVLFSPRIIEAVEEVLHGHLHKNGRLDVSSKIWASRTILYVLCFCIVYILTQDLLITGTVSLLVTAILCLLFNYSIKDLFNRNTHYERNSIWKLLKKCFPLALSTTLMSYIGSAPKYAIDGVVSNQEQTTFSVIFMSVFAITLLGNYIFNPMIGKLTLLWENKNTNKLFNIVLKIVGLICAITFIGIVGGETIGIIVLEILYKVDLTNYTIHLALLIFTGGLLTLLNFTIIIATIVRKQQLMQTCIITGTALWFLLSSSILKASNLVGLIIFFAFVLLIILLLAGINLYKYITAEKK